jgi:ribosome-associated heat shock protein Hsp15
MRADKWLYFARFCKTRALATALIGSGHMRVNSTRTAKPAHPLAAGDVLTFSHSDRIRVIRILSLPQRRGPAPEAQATYEDLSPPPDPAPPNPRFDGKGRPTAKDRRNARLSGPTPLE